MMGIDPGVDWLMLDTTWVFDGVSSDVKSDEWCGDSALERCGQSPKPERQDGGWVPLGTLPHAGPRQGELTALRAGSSTGADSAIGLGPVRSAAYPATRCP